MVFAHMFFVLKLKKNDLVHRDNYFKDNFSYRCLRDCMIIASTNEMQKKKKK